MSEPEQRIGFGEPVTFEGKDADLIRKILESNVAYPNITNDKRAHDRLRRIAVPPVEVCVSVRRTLTEAADHIGGVDVVPDIDDPDREDFERSMDNSINSARAAFTGRPEGCEMKDLGDDWYDCRRCDFEVAVDL